MGEGRAQDGRSPGWRAHAAVPAAAWLLATATTACDDGSSRQAPLSVAPPHSAFDAIPAAPVQGKIRGIPFTMRTARYAIDRRDGYERVDILLSAAAADGHCGPWQPKDAPSLWLRRKGAEPIARAELRLQPDAPAAWEVHYQLREDDLWVGSGQAAALLKLRPSGKSTTIAGELSTCFADGHASCVAGTFQARQCPVLLDMPVRGNEPVEHVPPERREATAADGGDAASGVKAASE